MQNVAEKEVETESFLVKADNVNVFRGNNHLLRHVSLTVEKDDFVTIVGPNGAGKSLLLKCLMGLLLPDEGNVERAEELRIGYVPQSFNYEQTLPLKVRNFLTLRQKVSCDDVQALAQEIGIEDLLNRSLHALSGGELQRVLLTRALLRKPNLLVLDEPAKHLDISGQLAFYSLLHKVYTEKPLSVLMVSHDLHMVMASTKRVICLFHHVCCSGEPRTVMQDPEFVKMFGKDMANMMAIYQHSHYHDHEDDHT